MKKIFLLLLVGLCAAGNCLADCPELEADVFGYKYIGKCSQTGNGSGIWFTLDETNTLAFWYNNAGDVQCDDPTLPAYTMPNYINPDAQSSSEGCVAPWYAIRDEIQAVKLSRLSNIGEYAFAGLTNITTFEVPEEITSIGKFAFWGCNTDVSLHMLAIQPPRIESTTLKLDNAGHEIMTILVEDNTALTNYQTADYWPDNNRVISLANPIAPTRVIIKNWDGSDLADGEPLFIKPGETKALQFELYPADASRDSVALSISMEPEDSEPPYMPIIFSEFTVKGLREAARTLYVRNKTTSSIHYASVKVVCSSKEYYLYGDACGDNVVCTLTKGGELEFWVDEVGKDRGPEVTYVPMWDFENQNDPATPPDARIAPWYKYINQIRSINTNNLTYIGNNAFRDIPNIKYVIISDDITGLGENVFMSSLNLGTLEMRRYTDVPAIGGTTLIIDGANNVQVPTIVVPAVAFDMYNVAPWNTSTLIPNNGQVGNVDFTVGESDSISQSLALGISSSTDELKIQGDGPFPWDDFGDKIKDLQINDNVSYIGKNAFASLENVEVIQFHHNNHPLDSIHIEAFAPGIKPRKFALGDPQDGAVIPPKVIGYSAELLAQLNFNESTVRFVPDSMILINGELRKVIDLYKEADFWKEAFRRINDRTVDSTVMDTSVVLTWIPLDEAQGYRLTIQEVGCADCDTTIFIPADGLLGLIDWVRINNEGLIPQYLAAPKRRAPQEEGDGGGLVLTISIKSGSGSEHTSDVAVNVAGKKGKDYTFTREVIKEGKVSEAYTKAGSFHVADKSTAIEEIQLNGEADTQRSEPMIYDLLGRQVGISIDKLPNGIYIMDNGTERTKIMLRR